MELDARLAVDDKLRGVISDLIFKEKDGQMIRFAANRLPEYKKESTQHVEVSGKIEHVGHVSDADRAMLISEAASIIEADFEDVA